LAERPARGEYALGKSFMVMSANPNDASAVSIKSSVGRRGMNIRGDVMLIQELLNRRLMVPMRPLRVDGTCGPITISTIEEFQRRVVG